MVESISKKATGSTLPPFTLHVTFNPVSNQPPHLPTVYSKIEHSKIYGPLWVSKYGPLVVVNVASPELIEQVLRQEGRHPIRTDMPHWRRYRELRNQAQGPLTE